MVDITLLTLKKLVPILEYLAEWENIKARIIRPDVQCTDGVIHVIDKVLVQRREISVSGQEQLLFSPLLVLVSTVFLTFWNGP